MVELFFTCYFSILFLFCVVMTIRDSLFKGRTFHKIKNLKVSKKKMVEDVLQWCIENYPTPKNRSNLYYKINYYEHKKLEGNYCGFNKRISIYITPEKSIIDVVDTILHEYQHHIEIRTQKDLKIYYKQLDSYGYDNHPMEISARKFGKHNRNRCYEQFKNCWF